VWEAWLEFFLTGVKETSEQAMAAAQRIAALMRTDELKVKALGRAASSAAIIYQHAQRNPIFSIASAAKKTGLTFPTASSAVKHLRGLGILNEITKKKRRRLFVYRAYLNILNEGTEPLR
jgi:Fic family protein